MKTIPTVAIPDSFHFTPLRTNRTLAQGPDGDIVSDSTTIDASYLESPGTQTATGARVYLVVRRKQTEVIDVAEGDRVVFGRSPEATVTIDDARASREHARFERKNGELWLEDLGSRNGTRVGEDVVRGARRRLASGDVVRIGDAEIVVAVAAGSIAGGRLETELARTDRAALVRLVVKDTAALESVQADLGASLLVEQQGEGEYAVLLPTDGLLPALERLRRAGDVTVANYPEDGKTAAALWAKVVGRVTKAAPRAIADLPASVVIADPAMVKLFELARRVASAPTTVLILGETGVGKEVVAEQIHRWSTRAKGPFVRLNCASLPETLLESELFGHERGAFTGADRRKIGYLEAADGGTLFLDEIGELSAAMQAKLLRVIETRRVIRVGGTQELGVDVRIVSATHRDLKTAVGEGRFREDLFFRLTAFVLEVPPLRTRPTEILLLAELFLRQLAARQNASPPPIEADAQAALTRHAWPGNVRELRNAVEHALVLAGGQPINAEHLPDAIKAARAGAPQAAGMMKGQLEAMERKTIEDALDAENGNRTRAARRLGISRRALIYKIGKYGIDR
jgi:DNA-binding NtrC family response regulator/pSer/pThr/pTyr-binding forkhead associated (FHA) protein